MAKVLDSADTILIVELNRALFEGDVDLAVITLAEYLVVNRTPVSEQAMQKLLEAITLLKLTKK